MLLYAVTDRMWAVAESERADMDSDAREGSDARGAEKAYNTNFSNDARNALGSENECVPGERKLLRDIENAIKGGATCIQLREKELSHEDFVRLAFDVKKVTDKYTVPFIINDDVDVMLEVDADGIHVGQQDEECLKVRTRIGPDKILGVSAETVEQALEAQKNGADYLGVGAVFVSSTKTDADSVSFETLKNIKDAVNIPITAIGGITLDNMSELSFTGIEGVAVVSAIFAKSDILLVTKALHQRASMLFERPKIASAIFDLDGTLVDSMPMWETVADKYLLANGIEPPKNFWEFFKVMSLRQSAEYMKDKYFPSKSVQEIMDGLNEQTALGYSKEVCLKDGVKEFLEMLKSKNIPCAVATATDRKYVEVCLKRLGIIEYFSVIKTCTEVGEGKDTPKVFDEAALALGATRQASIVFEDAAHAIRTAVKAGYRVCAVYDNASKEDEDAIIRCATWYGKTLGQSFPIDKTTRI